MKVDRKNSKNGKLYYKFNLLERLIRKNSFFARLSLAKVFRKSKVSKLLTIQTEDIANEVYLSKFGDETILDELIKNIGISFSELELERRVNQNKKIGGILVKNGRYPSVTTVDVLLSNVDGMTYLESYLNNEKDILGLNKHISKSEDVEKIVFDFLNKKEQYSSYDIQIIRYFICGSSKELLLKFYENNLSKLGSYLPDLLDVVVENVDKNIVHYFIKLGNPDLVNALGDKLLLARVDEGESVHSVDIQPDVSVKGGKTR